MKTNVKFFLSNDIIWVYYLNKTDNFISYVILHMPKIKLFVMIMLPCKQRDVM